MASETDAASLGVIHRMETEDGVPIGAPRLFDD